MSFFKKILQKFSTKQSKTDDLTDKQAFNYESNCLIASVKSVAGSESEANDFIESLFRQKGITLKSKLLLTSEDVQTYFEEGLHKDLTHKLIIVDGTSLVIEDYYRFQRFFRLFTDEVVEQNNYVYFILPVFEQSLDEETLKGNYPTFELIRS